MKINVEQVWEYEFKPTDTLKTLKAFQKHWELKGDEIILRNRGGRLFAIRVENNYLCPEIEKGKELINEFPSIRG